MIELEQHYAALAAQLPDGPPDEAEFLFRQGALPAPPTELASRQIFFRKIARDYNGWHRVDRLALFVNEATARALGLHLLACVFHDPASSVLTMSSEWSEVRRLVYRARWPEDDPPLGLVQRPASFRYVPSASKKHPWLHERDAASLPLLALSNEAEVVLGDDEWHARDTVFVESSAVGTVRLAELLLNASCSWNTTRDYDLESDAGFRGVAPMSAELSVVLPGSDHWNAHPELRRSTRPPSSAPASR